MPLNVNKYTLEEIEEALQKKRKIHDAEQTKIREAKELELLKSHTPCPIVGMAYTGDRLIDTELVKFTIRGNGSTTYNINFKVAPGVAVYFGNCIPSMARYNFENYLCQQAKTWIENQFTNEPGMIADLMALSCNGPHKAWAEDEGAKHLASKFTKEQLTKIKQLFHGQAIISKALKLLDDNT